MKSRRLFPIVLLIIACSVLLTWQVGRYAHDWSMVQLKDEGENRLLRVISQFRSALGEYQYLPFLISQNRDVKSLLLSPAPDKIAAVSRYLEQTNLVAGSTALFVLDITGRAQAFSHWREQQDFYLISHADAPYFEQAKKGQQGIYVSLPDALSGGSFYLSAPIYDHSRFVGAATVRVDLELLQPELPQIESFIISQRGRVLLASEERWALQKRDEVMQPVKQIELGDGTVVDIRKLEDDRQVLVQSVLLDDLGWQIAVISHTEDVQRVARTATLYSLGGCIAFSLLLLWLRERRLKNISRQETREALERNEAKQRNIINKARVGLITLNSRGDILFINPMAMQLFGVSMPRVLGISISQLIAADAGHGPLRKTLARVGQAGFAPITGLETVGVRADQTEFPMLFSIKEMEPLPEAVYLVTVIDITPRKKLERALQQANDQLEQKVLERTQALKEAQSELVQAEKMAALGRMSSAMVHELNQPLTALRTYISICRHLLAQQETDQNNSLLQNGSLSLNKTLDENLELINGLTDRMAVLTKQLKVFAYKKPQQLSAVDPAQVLDQSLVLFRERLKQDAIELEYSCPEQGACFEGISVAGDSARVEQIFVNLIKNACDAMAADTAGRKHKLSILIASLSESQIKISVCDTGPGINEQDLDHLFEPFFTTKSIGDGLGLGLSIVQSIVRDLSGEITVFNQPEGGACFEVRLPKYRGSAVSELTENKA
ncbi:MAG: ATP-binding protein [Amphritea sp.]